MVSKTEKHQVNSRQLLIAGAVILQLSYVALAILYNWNANLPLFLVFAFLAFFTYCVLVYSLERLGSISLRWILIPALLFRATVFCTPPTLSEDFYRYLWDGRVQKAGILPYRYPPEASQLEFLRNENFAPINHKEFRTPYPAAAESFFHLFALLSSKPFVFKMFIAGFDILLLLLLAKLLKTENRASRWLLMYAWHPLPVLEFAGSGHMDVIGITLLITSYLLIMNHKQGLAGLCFAAAVLTKFLPALTFPWFIKRGSWKFILVGAIAGSLLLLQYYTPDWIMFSGAMSYYKKWRFNDSLFGFLYKWLGGAEPARKVGAVITIAIVAYSWIAKFSFYRGAFLAFATVLLFSPVVHPWYLCWVLPFLVFHRNRAWLFLSGWILLAYLERYFFPVGVWKPILWLKLLIYLPFYLLLIFDIAGPALRRFGARETSLEIQR